MMMMLATYSKSTTAITIKGGCANKKMPMRSHMMNSKTQLASK
jgi:hypothetical protein